MRVKEFHNFEFDAAIADGVAGERVDLIIGVVAVQAGRDPAANTDFTSLCGGVGIAVTVAVLISIGRDQRCFCTVGRGLLSIAGWKQQSSSTSHTAQIRRKIDTYPSVCVDRYRCSRPFPTLPHSNLNPNPNPYPQPLTPTPNPNP